MVSINSVKPKNQMAHNAPIMKLSKDKITLPGRKQVYRFTNGDGTFKRDTIALTDESAVGEPLLVKVMDQGKLLIKLPSLDDDP